MAKQPSAFENHIRHKAEFGAKFCPEKITRWGERESLEYMKRFFADPDRQPSDITKQGFIPDAYQSYLPILISAISVVIPDELLIMLQILCRSNQDASDVLNNLKSYELTKEYYQHEKKEMVDKHHTLEDVINHSRIDYNVQNIRSVLGRIMLWQDTFKDVCKAIVIATDYILNNCVDDILVSRDLALKKMPEVVKFFKLDKYGAELLKFCYVFRASNIKLPRDVQSFDDRMNQIAEMTGVPKHKIIEYSANSGKKGFTPFIIETLLLQDNIWSYIANELSTDLESCFYKTMNTDDVLPREFFDEIDRKHTDTIVSILNSKSERPKHILLYGLPGTGKTSYMKLLCKLTGRKGYSITQIDNISNNGENRNHIMGVESRFMSVRICDGKVENDTSLIVVDEADEMINCSMAGNFGWFSGDNQYNTKTKSMLNQIMDEMKTPVIWITNNPSNYIDPSCRRRFDYSIFFDNFTENQRVTIWTNTVKRKGLTKLITAKDIKQLAADYAITPGGVNLACENVRDVFQGKKPTREQVHELLTKILDQHCQLLNMETPKSKSKKFAPCREYSLDGLNIKSTIPLSEVEKMCAKYLEKKARGEVTRGMCILLQGPSGTGKTEFVKYLGSVLKKDVEVARGSTVLDMYVGNTEKNIANAFANAERNDSILFMDEIDGLMQGREKAHRSWEVSQVNEILQQMENFHGIFIGATNFADNVDMASVRRFAFKFTFDSLTEDGVVKFYTRYFGKINEKDKLLPDLKNLRNVTPGDFATIKMLSEYTEDKIDLKWVIAALKRELGAKKSNHGAAQVKPRDLGY